MAVDEVDPLEAVRARLTVIPSPSLNGHSSTAIATATPGTVVGRSSIRYTMASEVSLEPPDFMWQGWIAKRAFQLIAGRQGAGKTTWASYLVALATTGLPFPDDPRRREPINVAFLSHEDPDTRVAARLKAAGADLSRALVLGMVSETKDDGSVERQWMMPRDVGALEGFIVEHRIGLVVIDGIGYSIASDGEPGYTAVGQALSALQRCAERTNCAILGLTHPSKGSNDPVTAAIGSTAWTAKSHIFCVLGIDKDDPNKRVVRVSKTNYKEPPTGFMFEIADDPETEAGVVRAVEASDVSSIEIMSSFVSGEERSALEDAKDFLTETLRDGARLQKDVFDLAKDEEIKETTLRRAAKALKVNSNKLPGKNGRWDWSLPLGQPIGPANPPERDRRQGYLEDGHAYPYEASRGSSDGGENLHPEQGFHTDFGLSELEDVHESGSDHLPNRAPSNIVVREDVEPSQLIGLPKMALIRHRAGSPPGDADERALVDGGYATWNVAR